MKRLILPVFIACTAGLFSVQATAQNRSNIERNQLLFNFNLNNPVSQQNVVRQQTRNPNPTTNVQSLNNRNTINIIQVDNINISNNRGRGNNFTNVTQTRIRTNVAQTNKTNSVVVNTRNVRPTAHPQVLRGNVSNGTNEIKVDNTNEVIQVQGRNKANSSNVEMPQMAVNPDANINFQINAPEINLDLELNAPKVNVDLELPKVTLPAIKLKNSSSKESRTREFKRLTVVYNTSETSAAKSESGSKGKHGGYSQSNKRYFGKKVKIWCKKNLKFAKKIRFSVSCPQF